MGSLPKPPETQSSAFELNSRFHAGLLILLEAYSYALELQRSVWDFAVEIPVLRKTGLTNSDLRSLVCRGVAEHAAEVTGNTSNCRVFHRTGRFTFTKGTCFVLTEAGAVLARQLHDAPSQPVESPRHASTTASASPVPEWDKERQELRLGEFVVKQFKVPAPNQEIILASFQEEGWPPRIDDPLPPQPDQDAKRRLHDTINTLNRHQKHELIRFLGDGTGEGIRWELLSSEQDSPQFS
jgi:hypothetical protein